MPGGTRAYWNSLELIKKGHSVTVIRYGPHAKEKITREVYDGIHIITLKINYSQSMGIMSRLKSYVYFMLEAPCIGLKTNHIDFAKCL